MESRLTSLMFCSIKLGQREKEGRWLVAYVDEFNTFNVSINKKINIRNIGNKGL
jgi:hypothetical protein